MSSQTSHKRKAGEHDFPPNSPGQKRGRKDKVEAPYNISPTIARDNGEGNPIPVSACHGRENIFQPEPELHDSIEEVEQQPGEKMELGKRLPKKLNLAGESGVMKAHIFMGQNDVSKLNVRAGKAVYVVERELDDDIFNDFITPISVYKDNDTKVVVRKSIDEDFRQYQRVTMQQVRRAVFRGRDMSSLRAFHKATHLERTVIWKYFVGLAPVDMCEKVPGSPESVVHLDQIF